MKTYSGVFVLSEIHSHKLLLFYFSLQTDREALHFVNVKRNGNVGLSHMVTVNQAHAQREHSRVETGNKSSRYMSSGAPT